MAVIDVTVSVLHGVICQTLDGVVANVYFQTNPASVSVSPGAIITLRTTLVGQTFQIGPSTVQINQLFGGLTKMGEYGSGFFQGDCGFVQLNNNIGADGNSILTYAKIDWVGTAKLGVAVQGYANCHGSFV